MTLPRPAFWGVQVLIGALLVANAYLGMTAYRPTRAVLEAAGLPRWAPDAIKNPMMRAGMFQRWKMFAPCVNASEGRIVVDGVTADGQHIDPITLTPPDFGPARGPTPHDEFWRKHEARVAADDSGRLGERLCLWLARRHNGEATAPIVEATVWWVDDVSPEPGQARDGIPAERRRVATCRVP